MRLHLLLEGVFVSEIIAKMGAYDAEDFWSTDEFEDSVAATLVACFETKVKRWRGAAPPDRLTDKNLSIIRAQGPYIPGKGRLFMIPGEIKRKFEFPMTERGVPRSGFISYRPTDVIKDGLGWNDLYLNMAYCRKTSSLGKWWHRNGPGSLYELFTMFAKGDGITGWRSFFTIDKHGEITPCTQAIPELSFGVATGKPRQLLQTTGSESIQTSMLASLSLQAQDDRLCSWVITAQEQGAKAHLGCDREEIKSLLYARSLPMTATGRKRPILHLVEAHKRRLRNGTDIDVTGFLRGQQSVQIGGTLFTVRPPEIMRANLSESSQKRFFNPEQSTA